MQTKAIEYVIIQIWMDMDTRDTSTCFFLNFTCFFCSRVNPNSKPTSPYLPLNDTHTLRLYVHIRRHTTHTNYAHTHKHRQ